MMTLQEPDADGVSWVVEQGTAKRIAAKRRFNDGIYVADLDPAEGEAIVRDALAMAASALYWLEDTEYEEAAHQELHEYGLYARENFPAGCRLHWTGRGYEQRCPVAIAHKRFGFSIGFVGNRMCGICGEDVSECAHLPGQFYDKVAVRSLGETCSICGTVCNEHVPGRAYRIRATVLITDATLEEVSIVSKPAQPDARLTAIPVDTTRLRAQLGSEFRPGMTVNCDRCLGECDGFDRLDDSAGPPG
jgi:hypothetical protein